MGPCEEEWNGVEKEWNGIEGRLEYEGNGMEETGIEGGEECKAPTCDEINLQQWQTIRLGTRH